MTRADLHVHSTASQVSRLGVQRALGLPECATPPEEATPPTSGWSPTHPPPGMSHGGR